jgi:hypothetical protein
MKEFTINMKDGSKQLFNAFEAEEKRLAEEEKSYYAELRRLYYKETGIEFVPKELDPDQVKPGFLRRFGRVVWPFRLFTN